jgi:3-carboxy-cis,cis-muconate cycloisomerase
MTLLDKLFGSESIHQAFSDEATVQRMLDFEAALARAEASLGVIPATAATAIEARCKASKINFASLSQNAAEAGNLAIPLVKQLTDLVQKSAPGAARYVHWGATSQDVIDTGFMLQARDALSSMLRDADRLCEALAQLTERHRATPMVARTWMQHAIPTVFGFKVAGWLDSVHRSRARIEALQEQSIVLQFGGAAGTLAALGNQGLAVSRELAKQLSITLPEVPWHAQRDRIAEIATTLAMLVGSLGKVARDIALQTQTEVGELSEPAKVGRGGSSTMPHKRNPVNTAVVLAAAERVPALAASVLGTMPQEHERGLGNWPAEWETVPQIFRLAGGALERMVVLIEGLEVHADRMLANLDLTRGLIYAEAVSMALAARVGKPEAHRMVEDASRKALAEGKHLREVVAAEPGIVRALSLAELDRLFEPGAYTGESSRFIDRVLASHHTIVNAGPR